MYPTICTIGPLTIYSYGVMLAMAVIVCTFLLSRDAKKIGIDANLIFDFVFTVVLSGILGARLFFVLLNVDYFFQYPLEVIMIHNGGLAFQGGLIAGIATGLWFIKRKQLHLLQMADLVAPYVALGQSIGRVGCFLNGCCYGRHSDHGIFFPVHADTLHPTQLYSTLGLLAIFFVLKKYKSLSTIPGDTFVLYLLLASILRFTVEFFRADHHFFILGFSVYQIVCIVIFCLSLYVHTRLKSQRRT